MAEFNPDNFDPQEPQEQMVREYLSAALDGQTGRAEARFRQFLREEQPAPIAYKAPKHSSRFRGWPLSIAGAALAASLAALWAGPALHRIAPDERSRPSVATTDSTPDPSTVQAPMLVEQDVRSQTFDDGTFMADDSTPVRVLHRRDFQRTRWFDQNRQLKAEQVVPRDHLVYVQLKTY
ncbi:MAG TPA: hypothetical protein VFC78_10060 [Tepidisphaeraceae bacterium]|nr:hypothetical protein [Tepidisphaeraceae bacterium]